MSIAIQNQRKEPRIPSKQIRRIAQTICADLGYNNFELSILVTDDDGIQELNRTWRSKDKPTDVLSFPQLNTETTQENWPEFPDSSADTAPEAVSFLGDIVISAETTQRQAKAAGVSLESEFRRLLVHGILHLLGYDHVHGGRQAAKMRREENRILELLDTQLGAG